MVAGLEAAMEVDQERMSGGVDHLKDPLLTHKAAGKQPKSAQAALNLNFGALCSDRLDL